MVDTNKILKILFICLGIVLVMVMSFSPKTHCQACALEDFDGKVYDGYEAFEVFEDACISYLKPWEDQPGINFTFPEEGVTE